MNLHHHFDSISRILFYYLRMRSVGSCKIGVTCPAAMEVTEYLNGVLKVIYYKTHLGHLKDVVHLKLSKEERASLAGDH